MLGWQIIIYPEGAEGSVRSAATVATWKTGLGGTDWLERLVQAGKADSRHAGGYPRSYRMLWRDLLPELLNQPQPYDGPPVIGEDYVMEPGWFEHKTLNRAALALCQADDWMIVDAWDQS